MNKSVELPNGWESIPTDKLAIKGARVFDPSIELDQVADIIIINGIINSLGTVPEDWDGKVINADGWLVVPGLFDMHVHLREPGYEYKETVQSGCIAAVAGGFTGVACMPNTDPAIDNPSIIEFIRDQAEGLPVDVHPIPSVTRGRAGEALVDFSELIGVGATAFSDDGSPVGSASLMRRALEYVRMSDSVVVEHCEECSLSGNGVMHEGEMSTRLGLPGWPSIAEDIALERNIRLAEFTGGRLHAAHISTAASADLIRQAKARGVNLTAEVTPHHLSLDCSLLKSFDSNYKVNPPLRTPDDIEALIEALADGTIDAIATDHAPHAKHEKEVELIHAPFGMIGLETAVGVLLTKLVNTDLIGLDRMIDALSIAPRRILKLPEAKIETGMQANLAFIDTEQKWTVDRARTISKSANTPFHGWELKGKIKGVVNRNLAWVL